MFAIVSGTRTIHMIKALELRIDQSRRSCRTAKQPAGPDLPDLASPSCIKSSQDNVERSSCLPQITRFDDLRGQFDTHLDKLLCFGLSSRPGDTGDTVGVPWPGRSGPTRLKHTSAQTKQTKTSFECKGCTLQCKTRILRTHSISALGA